MRIGIFGGTFDPPHIGHLILADEAFLQMRLDRLLWVLTPDPPHKQGRPVSPLEQRLELVQMAIVDNPAFTLSRVELDRPGPHFAIDTVRLLQEQNPGAELVYLVGGDSLHDLPGWRSPQELVALIDGLGVMRRPQDQVDLQSLEHLIPGISKKITFINAPLVEIAAHDIRARIAAGDSFRYLVLPVVYELIRRQGYYFSPT
jgi:nicotinate-nucleotide adenylyltransferase